MMAFSTGCLMLVLLAAITGVANGVVQPPRLFSQLNGHESSKWDPHFYENQSAELLISGPATEELLLQQKSSLKVRLTRAVDEPVNVLLFIKSDPPGLLDFDTDQPMMSLVTTEPPTYKLIYLANEFGDKIVAYHSNNIPGHAEIICKLEKQPSGEHIDVHKAFVSIDIGRSSFMWNVIKITGWLYFAAWSISFYPQVVLNYQRKSVVGLNFDFVALNLIGFVMYSIYNISLLYSRTVQEDYYTRYAYSRIPVEYNDLFFSIHATIITLITILQCFLYERDNQRLSMLSTVFGAVTILAGFLLYLVNQFGYLTSLNVILYFCYVKLTITLIKYIPQAYMNYKRQSTVGWSIHNIILDSTGGVLSLGQMLISAYNYNDWISIFGNPTKFGLGVFSISFDILFFLQHYVFYKHSHASQMDITGDNDEESDGNASGTAATIGGAAGNNQRHQDLIF